MKLREPEKQILDDFEHKVTGKIAKYGNEPDFPKFENYGITRMELDDYLFDKQSILDMGGSKRSQLTIGGFITVLPVLVLSCFPDKSPVYDNGKMLATVIAVIIWRSALTKHASSRPMMTAMTVASILPLS